MSKLWLLLIPLLLSACASLPHGGASMDDESLSRLIFSFERNVQLQPGQTHQFSLNKAENWRLEPVKADVRWSVKPAAGAAIDPKTGLLTVDRSAPSGSVYTVTAKIENGRRIMKTEVYVYTPEANPLVGVWREKRYIPCGGDGELKPGIPVEELVFRADGTFSVTWRPFEAYKDYWGKYTYDLAKRTVSLQIEGGNDIPPVMDKEGHFSVTDEKLTFEKMWLGSPGQPRIKEENRSGPRPYLCSSVFERR